MKRLNIRTRFRIMVMIAVVLTMALTGLLVAVEVFQIGKNVSKEYARLYTNELVGHIEAQLSREVSLALKAGNTFAISDWMLDEANPVLKEKAFEELDQFGRLFQDKNTFVVVDESKAIYFLEAEMSFDQFEPNGLLSADMEEDIWYFKTVEQEKPYTLNVDVDRFLHTMRVWINVVVKRDMDTIGVIGTGIYLDSIVEDVFKDHQNPGVKSIIINEFGAIQLDEDIQKIKQNSFEASDSDKQTLYDYIDDPLLDQEIKQYLDEPSRTKVFPYQSKDYHYIGIGQIEDTNWYVITFYDEDSLYTPVNAVLIIGLSLLTMIVLAVTISMIVSRTFFVPFEALKASILEKKAIEDYPLAGLDRQDEFGDLARSIQKMSERLVQSVPVGMFILDEQGKFTYGNPYFINQFKPDSWDAFYHGVRNTPEERFVRSIDFQKLKEIIKGISQITIFEAELKAFDGTQFWAEISISKVQRDESLWQFEGILINVQNKKEHEKELVNMATTDQLTGLFNRHYFDQVVNEEMNRCDRYGGFLTMMIFDLDLFKQVNDIYGHDVGDQVLFETARVAKECLRKSDIIARWGGEEFAVLLPGTDGEGAFRVGDKIRKRLEEFIHPKAGTVTASFGVAQRLDLEIYSDWFKRVDQMLFKAKSKGRNRVVKAKYSPSHNINFVRLYWKDEFCSGNPIIDEQHRRLFDLANQLMEHALMEGTEELIISEFVEMTSHLKQHFSDEIQVLKDINYPEVATRFHETEHNRLVSRMEELRRMLEIQAIKGTDILSALITEVVVDHMIREDMKFFEYTHEN